MLGTLLGAIKLVYFFLKEDLPHIYLYVFAVTPILFVLSEFTLRKILNKPFRSMREIVETIFYLIIGVIMFQTAFQTIAQVIQKLPFVTISLSMEESFLLGLVMLMLAAILSPLTAFVSYFKQKYSRYLFLFLNAMLFALIMRLVMTDLYEFIKLSLLLYLAFGFVYSLTVNFIVKRSLEIN